MPVQNPARLFDFAPPRQENEDVAIRFMQCNVHNAPQMERPVLVRLYRRVLDTHRETASDRADARGVEPARDALAIQRRRHHDETQIRAQLRLHVEGERGAQVPVQMAFVEFVEQDGADAGQFRIGLDQAGEDPLGHHFHARACRNFRLETDAIADGFADRFAQLRGHELGRRARGEAARFQDEDFLAGQPFRVEQGQWHLGGLARAGRRFQHQARMPRQVRQQFRQYRLNRKLRTFAHRTNADPATRAGSKRGAYSLFTGKSDR